MEPVPLRLPTDLTQRLDELIPYVASDPGIRATGAKVSRASVARLALELGARILEERKAAGLPPVEGPKP